jgi:hypothetical protein
MHTTVVAVAAYNCGCSCCIHRWLQLRCTCLQLVVPGRAYTRDAMALFDSAAAEDLGKIALN